MQKKFCQFKKRLYLCIEVLRTTKHPSTMANHNYRTIESSSQLAWLAVSVEGAATSGSSLFYTLPQCTINFSQSPTGNY